MDIEGESNRGLRQIHPYIRNKNEKAYDVQKEWFIVNKIICTLDTGTTILRGQLPVFGFANEIDLQEIIKENEQVDISNYTQLKKWCKRLDGVPKKKARVFTEDQLHKFFTTAPDEVYFL